MNINFRSFKKIMTLILSISILFSTGMTNVVLAGTGTSDDPYLVAEAIAIQDNSTASVKGYIVGQPTSSSTVITSGFPNDYAIALADSPTETDTTKMIYVQVASDFRTDFGLKSNPDKLGALVKVTGNLTSYYTPHPGIKSITSMEEVVETPIGKVAPVTADPAPGEVLAGTLVTLNTTTTGAAITYTLTPGADVYYTYENPITINEDTIISAYATKDGMEDSDLSIFNYTIKQPLVLSSIAEARDMTVGQEVMVEGTVLNIQGSFGSGKAFYIEDDTAGALIYTNSDFSLAVGNKVKVTGTTSVYNGKFEISPSNVEITDTDTTSPDPIEITVNIIGEEKEGQLIKLSDVEVTEITSDSNKSAYITVSDGSNEATVKLDNRTGYTINDVTTAVGDVINVVGVIEQSGTDPDTYNVMIRNLDDITATDVPADTEAPVITHTPVVKGNVNLDLSISAQITDNVAVTGANLYYRTKGTTDFTTVSMTASGNDEYIAVIPSSDLDLAGLEYYIEATDGTNLVTDPADVNTLYEVSISNDEVNAPEITSLSPASDAVLDATNTKPGISVEYTDDTAVDTNTVQLFLDGTDITSSTKVKATGVTYTMNTDLSLGQHTARIVVSDTLGNKADKEWHFTIGETAYNLYFGGLHSHTNISDGQGTPDEAFTCARDEAHADFMAITDHSNWFDHDTENEDITSVADSTSEDWKTLRAKADEYNEDGKFVAIGGYEMTWSGSTGGWGHINTFNTAWFASRSNSEMDLPAYYSKLAQDTGSISQLNHPGTTFGDFDDFNFYTPEADAVVDLIEVGNGEGEVRSSGYFPSYSYYTRALDKGWHLAPTNNQDNHKGNWLTANDARTVILAENLTRDDLYDAIRNRRVYATEDKNLRINYTVNGNPMGTILDNPDKLNITIEVTDPDAGDTIKSISLISDGGTVSAKKDVTGTTTTWNLTLDPNYNYYYVRVDETDLDIAVTAPIWTKAVTPVGISKVSVSQDPQLVNQSVDLTASVYNNSTSALSDVKVEFYKDSISSDNRIGEQTITSIDAANSSEATISWTATTAGEYKIYAQTVINVDGTDKVFMASTSFKAVTPEDLVKVVIDGGHVNQYVSGDYPGKILTLTQMLKDKEYMLVQNNDELTADDLDNTKLLIITDPQSKDKSGLTRSNYTADEISVIKNFVDNGGALIITSRADYDDNGVTDAEYESSKQGNSILEAIGSNLRFNDDEVVDYENNGGQSYRLYFDDYTSTKYGLTDDIPLGETYSAYSGCSVILKDEGEDTDIDWLVKGHDTTETMDSDNQNDNIAVAKGDVEVLAAEILPSGAKIVVAGTTFFSDFETASSDNAYSNKEITDNIIDWMIQPNSAELKTIAEVRADADNDGIPDNLGKTYSIEGRVTAASKAAVTNTAFFDAIYVQDETGGITVFGVSDMSIPLGANVKITGVVDQYDGDTELQISNENTDIEFVDNTISFVEPKTMTTAESMLEENEGWLVKVEGEVTRIEDNALYLDDGSGEAKVYVNGYIGDDTDNSDMLGKWDPTIEVGDTVSAIGLASQDADGHRIRVRNTSEICKAESGYAVDVKVAAPVKVVFLEDTNKVEYYYSINNAVNVDTFDISIGFDSNIMNLTHVDLTKSGIMQYKTYDDHVRIMAGFVNAISNDEEMNLIKLTFEIKDGVENGTSSSISILNSSTVSVEDDQIAESNIIQDSATVTIYDSLARLCDLDGSGEVDSLDLHLAIKYYQATSEDANWEEEKVADVNFDGVVDTADFTMIILQALNQ